MANHSSPIIALEAPPYKRAAVSAQVGGQRGFFELLAVLKSRSRAIRGMEAQIESFRDLCWDVGTQRLRVLGVMV